MQSKDYLVEELLKKTPTKIFIWSLLMSSESHWISLIEVLSGVTIPKETTSETLGASSGRIVEANKISFHDDQFPAEGFGHNKVIHIAFKEI